jgi:hypothetical protein
VKQHARITDQIEQDVAQMVTSRTEPPAVRYEQPPSYGDAVKSDLEGQVTICRHVKNEVGHIDQMVGTMLQGQLDSAHEKKGHLNGNGEHST